ncbi:hypothetical protein OEZ85_001723 [Tetradesmus obliquus]|uniref:Amino acid transporter transmembrane domain-containing protein n=1 Tax=Tetradesmus obliquus TaxID=3088 RepID=A0ABY8U0Q8_TETOB|nr:hypothetical protein OEZ85_001723 [Tetradesmus obliquus]
MQRSDTQVSFVVEDDEDTWGSGDTERRAFFSACITLTLGVLGSSILPIPFAISKTGVLVGVLTMLLVAWANDATSCMLIRAAAATGKPTYEALAEWAGGRPWKVFTQVSLVLLLWGTMCGGLCLISDVGHMLLQRLGEGQLPGWVNGRSCMAAVALLVLFPLCLQRHMRELEKAATAGVVVVAGLIALLATDAFQEGFPAIQDGQLPLWSLKVDSHLPEAFAVVGYAFYMQPMMMPLLREMPEGQHGVRIMQRAVHATLFGVALTVYFSMGLFGASLFGQDTEGNIMVNELVAGRAAVAALYGIMLLYLALGMTTTQYALRASLDLMVFGEEATFTWRRQVVWTTLTVGSSLTVALAVPDQAEKIYAVVGATAVCVVCYVIPVYIQLQMFRRSKQQRKLQVLEEDHPLAAALLQNAAAPYGAADCEATASAGPSLQTSSSSFCNSFHGMAGRRRLHQAWEVAAAAAARPGPAGRALRADSNEENKQGSSESFLLPMPAIYIPEFGKEYGFELPSAAGTQDDCSKTDTSAQSVMRCVNAVRTNPKAFKSEFPCSSPWLSTISRSQRSALSANSKLESSAQRQANDMARNSRIDHVGSDGSTVGQRIRDAGYTTFPQAENIAMGQTSAHQVTMEWMCSEGHRHAIMNCEYDEVGTAVAQNSGTWYYAQNFGCSSGRCPTCEVA